VEWRSLSRTEAKVVLSLEADERSELTLDGIRERARISRGFARKVAHNLVRKGWIQRVGRGRYLLNPGRNGPEALADTDPFPVGSRLASPYYFGFATAAELHGFLAQASRTYYVVTPRPGRSVWPFAPSFRRVAIAPKRFFGRQRTTRRGERLVISDPEKTVIDCLDRPEYSGGLAGVVQVIESAGRQLNWSRLERYLDRFDQRSLSLRLGFLIESLDLSARPPKSWTERVRPRLAEPYVPLGPPREFGRSGRHDARWHVIQNVPDALLRAELDVR
jgi:predicted transcriptional regulator of viral defense system